MAHSEALPTSHGLHVVLDLENGLELEDLHERVRTYAIATAYDGSLKILRRRVGAALSLDNPDHRAAVLAWLRQWGCRGLDLASEATSARALLAWGDTWVTHLPDPARPLTELSSDEIVTVAIAYGQLAGAVAGVRHPTSGDSHVTFGPTAAAKTMYALRPYACAPWDGPIRYRLGLSENDAAYRSYLQLVACALAKTAEQARVGRRAACAGWPVGVVTAEADRRIPLDEGHARQYRCRVMGHGIGRHSNS
jgi:hypothetical protein